MPSKKEIMERGIRTRARLNNRLHRLGIPALPKALRRVTGTPTSRAKQRKAHTAEVNKRIKARARSYAVGVGNRFKKKKRKK